MFFEVLDDIYLFLIKNKNMSYFNIFLLSLKICWNLVFLMFLYSAPFVVLYYLTSWDYFYGT